LGNCENFIQLVFDAFIDSEPVERAYKGGDMAGLRSFNDKFSRWVFDESVLARFFYSQHRLMGCLRV